MLVSTVDYNTLWGKLSTNHKQTTVEICFSDLTFFLHDCRFHMFSDKAQGTDAIISMPPLMAVNWKYNRASSQLILNLY